MRAEDPHDRDGRRPWRRRRFRPACENLELRALLTTIAPNLPGKHYPAPDVQQFVPLLYPPGTPQPTAAEVKRESFVAKGYGHYTIGPGEFDTQTISIHGFGKPMTSNISRKMHFQFVVFEPTDQSQAVDGTINLVGGNYLQNSSDLILYLVGPTSSEVNGLPTNLYFTMDANTPSATAFAETGESLSSLLQLPGKLLHNRRATWLLRPAHRAASGPPRAWITGAWPSEMRPSNTFLTNTLSGEVLARVLSSSSFWAYETLRALRARTISSTIKGQRQARSPRSGRKAHRRYPRSAP